MSESIYPRYYLHEDGFKKAVLILQLTRIEPMTMTQLSEETKVGNIKHIVKILVDMGYLKEKVKKDKARAKYTAVYRFQKIV